MYGNIPDVITVLASINILKELDYLAALNAGMRSLLLVRDEEKQVMNRNFIP